MSKQMTAPITKPSRAKASKPDLKPETREEWIARHAAKLAARRAELAALGLTAHDLAPAAWAEAALTPPVAELEEAMRIEPEPVPAIGPSYKPPRAAETPRYSHANGTLAKARAHLQQAGPQTIPQLAALLGRDEKFTRTVTLRMVNRGLAVELPDKLPSETTGRLLLVFAATPDEPYVPMQRAGRPPGTKSKERRRP